MKNYKGDLMLQLKELDRLLAKTNRNLARHKELQNLRVTVSKSNGHTQYYLVDKTSNRKKYVKVEEVDTVKRIAQRDYDLNVSKRLNSLKTDLERFLTKYDISAINQAFDELTEGRKSLVEPVVDTDEMFVEKWKSVPYEAMPITDDSEFFSDNGVRVRSKSELIIANMLEKNGIPYRYEYPLELKGFHTVRPDFTCLNLRERKEYIWEHFGMMDNIPYANANVYKIQMYSQNGISAGKNFIMTFESSQHAISSSIIKNMIATYLQ